MPTIAGYGPLLEERRFAYDLLRRAFLEEPGVLYLKIISQAGLIDTFPFSEENTRIGEGVKLLHAFFEQQDVLDKEVYQRLHWDYTRMFIGPYALPVPLWESAYVGEERLLFQEVTLNVRREYAKYSLLPKHYGHEADDHLGLELDFIFQLNELSLEYSARQEAAALQSVLEDQFAFLTGHVMKFTPNIVHNILHSAETDFYRGMAKLLMGFLEIDAELLKELLTGEP